MVDRRTPSPCGGCRRVGTARRSRPAVTLRCVTALGAPVVRGRRWCATRLRCGRGGRWPSRGGGRRRRRPGRGAARGCRRGCRTGPAPSAVTANQAAALGDERRQRAVGDGDDRRSGVAQAGDGVEHPGVVAAHVDGEDGVGWAGERDPAPRPGAGCRRGPRRPRAAGRAAGRRRSSAMPRSASPAITRTRRLRSASSRTALAKAVGSARRRGWPRRWRARRPAPGRAGRRARRRCGGSARRPAPGRR